LPAAVILAAASARASSSFSSLATSRKKRASSKSARCLAQASMMALSEACSFRISWAFSPSFQKSGWWVSRVRSSIRFCLLSTSKTPPQKLEPLFQVNQLL
jgi:hypothetical protein